MEEVKVYFAGEHKATEGMLHAEQWESLVEQKHETLRSVCKGGLRYHTIQGVVHKMFDYTRGFISENCYVVDIPASHLAYIADLLTGLLSVQAELLGSYARNRWFLEFLIGLTRYRFHVVLLTEDVLTVESQVEDLLIKLRAAYPREVVRRFKVTVDVVQKVPPELTPAGIETSNIRQLEITGGEQ